MTLIDPITAPADAAAALFDRIRSAPAELWITIRDEADVRSDLEEVQRRVAEGAELPLAGATFAVKDNIDVEGLPTTAAHPAFSRIADRSATVVQRLVDAGAVVVGKTNMDQFATGLVGARSPYGAVASAVHPDRVAGGSSSGSGAVVGWGVVDFSLGTDTAGSGRVPAAFSHIIGLKPTLGLLPLDGVLPASPSYDTVSVFAPTMAMAATVFAIAAGPVKTDPHSRTWSQDAPLAAPARPIVAVPSEADLVTLSPGMRAAFDDAAARVESLGAELRTVDLSACLEAAKLLYDGGLVAERAWSFGAFLAEHPAQSDPSVAGIASAAGAVGGVAVVAGQQRLLELTAIARLELAGTDALLLPTAALHPTSAAVAADPLGVNRLIGTFTNFVNLMDLAAVAVPASTVPGEGEFGVSFVTAAFHDQVAIDLAARFLGEPEPALGDAVPGHEVAVFGAHLRGEPLNSQLSELGARYVREVSTAPTFRMLLVEGAVERPAVVRSVDGRELPGELWRLSPLALTRLLNSIAAPLALGRIELADGSVVIGFTASVDGTERDITDHGGWRAYRAATATAAR